MILEVCANSYQSAINAQKSGAQRIELCRDLSVGGLTPSANTIKKVLKELTIPVFVLIRPRSGDFFYSDDEFEIMKKNIQDCKKLGVSGIVSGVLNIDKSLDIKGTRELLELSKPLPFTFHRAFDEVSNPKKVLSELIKLGVDRVLTSGQKPTAEEGIELLKELQEIGKNKITILAGSGINPNNAGYFKDIDLKEIHASASIEFDNGTVSDVATIKQILAAIDE